MDISVYYEEHEVFGTSVPTRIIYRFDRGEIDWDEEFLLLPTYFDFVRSNSDDFIPEHTVSVLLMSTDFMRHPVHTDSIGVYLPFLIKRIEQDVKTMNIEYADIEQLIIPLIDVELVMQNKLSFLYEEDDF